ncbi:glycoside hydrolase family 31 protein [Apiospora sp. TS-2023a]
MLYEEDGRLVFRYDAEKLWIEPWGPNALRVRATKAGTMPLVDWALDLPPPAATTTISISEQDKTASITNGHIAAQISKLGKLTIHDARSGKLLLEEYRRTRVDLLDPKCSSLEVDAREFQPITGYQQPYLDIKGSDLELAHRNSQASVPFALSSRGYGFLWNCPSVGRAVFGKNIMSFEASSSPIMDYWVVAGDTPAQIVEAYADVTGKVPMMPEYGLGFWQCKLRYQTQEELLGVAREYRKRNLPIDLIVIDFFHWPLQGEWKFDPTYWPDPDAMIQELKQLKIELMVSIWPTVDKRSENYDEMVEQGHLIRTERGIRTAMNFQGETVHFDATSPEARDYVWRKCKQNYHDRGIRVFWLDEAEPEYSVYDFDNYRYHAGSNLAVGNVYPRDYARAFYEGQTAAGQTNVVNLLRCAWAGSQRYGALVWSGDIASSWGSFRSQLAAGLNMGIAGLPWWTTDIGGFHGGDPNDPAFRELLVRWFQWGAFCPVMRLHGDREPQQPQLGTTGGAGCRSGAANEVWSFGDEAYEILKKYMHLREDMRDYIRDLMKQAHEKGTPIMRPLFYDFPADAKAWEVEQQYMFGPRYMCCPVLEAGKRKIKAYLPKLETSDGKWRPLEGDGAWEGGQEVEVDCPLEYMPVFN